MSGAARTEVRPQVKEALPYAQFGPWLKAEFVRAERMAQNFMRVAERFSRKPKCLRS